jgi:hypothetical protein
LKYLNVIAVVVLLAAGGAAPARADGPFPYELQDGTETAVLGGTALLFGLGRLADRSLEPLTPAEIALLDRQSVNGFDRGATGRWSVGARKASDIMLVATAVAPLGLLATSRGSQQPSTVGVMYLETFLLQGGITYLLKNSVARTRPFVYNDDPSIPADLKSSRTARRSFSSGHTATAFAAMVFTASVFERLYPDSPARGWVWGGCLAAATTTGYLRYAAGWHYPTDILAGAAIGAFAGWVVPRLHEIDDLVPGGRDKRGAATFGVSLVF